MEPPITDRYLHTGSSGQVNRSIGAYFEASWMPEADSSIASDPE